MTSLTLPAPDLLDPRDAPGLRWGIIGPGGIARTFTRTVQAATRSELVAVCSRSLDRAESFASEFAADAVPATAYDSIEEFLAHDGLDAVYVASPHGQHYDLALPVVEAGIPVLVEKAFTLNADQAREILEAAERTGAYVQEAMWSRFLPHYQIIKACLEEGLVGEILSLSADHGQRFAVDPEHRLYAPELGGGALLDLGIYPLSFAHHMVGDLEDMRALGTLTELGVDDTLAIQARGQRTPLALANPANVPASRPLVSLSTTLSARTDCTAQIVGRDGRIDIEGPFYTPQAFTLTRFGDSAEEDQSIRVDIDDQVPFAYPRYADGGAAGFAFEIAAAARAITSGQRETPGMTWADTLAVMEFMDEIRRQVGVQYPQES